MRGSIRRRYKGSWSIILELGRELDPATGRRKRNQKWVTFHGTKKQAEAKLAELLGAVHGGTFVEPSKVTLVDWLRSWLEKSIAPPMKRPQTFRIYRNIIEGHVAKSALALVPLQRVRSSDLEHYLAGISAGSVGLHASVLSAACTKAVRDRLLTVSPAVRLEYRQASDHAIDAGALLVSDGGAAIP